MRLVKIKKKVLKLATEALLGGKSLVYPTDTAYGLAVDATNLSAVEKLYRIKGRNFKKPVHIVVSSLAQAKKFVHFNKLAEKLFRKFLPGALTLVLPLTPTLSSFESEPEGSSLRVEDRKGRGGSFSLLSAGTGTLGIRMPDNLTALALVKKLDRPITATSANLSGGPDCYSAAQVEKQFKNRRLQPDLILDAGPLPPHKPSTVVAIRDGRVTMLRRGPISEKQIQRALKS